MPLACCSTVPWSLALSMVNAQSITSKESPSQPTGGRNRKLLLLDQDSGVSHHFHLHPIGHNLVTWPRLPSREAENHLPSSANMSLAKKGSVMPGNGHNSAPVTSSFSTWPSFSASGEGSQVRWLTSHGPFSLELLCDHAWACTLLKFDSSSLLETHIPTLRDTIFDGTSSGKGAYASWLTILAFVGGILIFSSQVNQSQMVNCNRQREIHFVVILCLFACLLAF